MRRLFFAGLIAAAILILPMTRAQAAPLLTPPAGMKEASLPHVAPGSIPFALVAQYRKDANGKVYWITITMRPSQGRNADETGIEQMAGMLGTGMRQVTPVTPPPCPAGAKCTVYSVTAHGGEFLASQPFAACGNRVGWLDKAIMKPLNQVIAQAYVRSGDDLYVANAQYAPNDTFGAQIDKALTTLCPPQLAESATPAPDAPAPVKAPAGWIIAALPSVTSADQPFVAHWITLGATSHFLDRLYVRMLLNVPDGVTAKEVSDAMVTTYRLTNPVAQNDANAKPCGRASAWTHTASGVDPNGRNTIVESMVTRGKDAWFVAVYTRDAQDAEDPNARATLDSLCPPQ